MTRSVIPRDLVLFGGSCAAFGMELVNTLDRLETNGRILLPAVASGLSLLSAVLAVRVIMARDGEAPDA